MRTLARLSAAVLLLGVLTAGALGLRPEDVPAGNGDLSELPGLLVRLHNENQRGAQLNTESQRVLDGMERKEVLIQDLVDNRVSLAETVSRLRQVVGDRLPHLTSCLRYAHPGRADGDLLFLHLIDWAQERLEDRPAEAMRVIARLQMEWRALRPTAAGGDEAIKQVAGGFRE